MNHANRPNHTITSFRLLWLTDFRLPMSSLIQKAPPGWHFQSGFSSNGLELFFLEETELEGVVFENQLTVKRLSCTGDYSEHILDAVLLPAFEKSTGQLAATLTWDHGELLSRLEVDNGTVVQTELKPWNLGS